MEAWAPIPGFGGFYEASDAGRVRSWRVRKHPEARADDPRVLVPKTCRKGRLHVLLYPLGQPRVEMSVHRAVLLAFVGPAPEGTEACHHNGDPQDNRIQTLRWDTRAANYADAMRHGTAVHAKAGERHHGARLWDDAVRAIRAEPPYDGVVQMLARAFAVSDATVRDVRRGRYWGHVP